MQQSANPSPQLAAIRDKARKLHAEGRLAEALEAHIEALKLAPTAVAIWLSAGNLAYSLGMQESSLRYFEQAARLDPRCGPAVDAVLRICIALGLSARAQPYVAMARHLDPNDIKLTAMTLMIPAIADSTAAIRESRRGLEQALDHLLASAFELAQPDGALGASAFFLAYHGQNDRALQIKAAQMFAKAIPSLRTTAPHCLAACRRPGRIRVGFISRFFYSHSIFTTTRGLVDRLSRERFEVFVLRITPSRTDESTERIRASADRALDLDPDPYRARAQIAALELDILFYQDIGMEPTSYWLAHARLAPVQCVSFGHPNTTGIPTMDYFVSSDLFEPAEAASHYSERLYLLHGLPTLAYYYRPALPASAAVAPPGRAALGLPTRGTLYVCPQTLYKLHPDFDLIMLGILDRDPHALIVLIEGQLPDFTEQLRARFARTLPRREHRVVFLNRMDFPRFLSLLAASDVILDSVHFNGMNCSLESFAMGTPIVTLPGGLQRGRHTQAMYRAMGITDAIAKDAADYVEIAVRIGTDRACAESLRERIRSRSHVLFEDRRVIEEFERFFLEAHARACAAARGEPANDAPS
jgi:predicted O-linked N-acetylglucosamine transferase (SPINDLY family)